MLSGGVNHSANNIFTNTDSMLSRTRSAGGGASESHMRDLSRKDTASVTAIAKDELEYDMRDGMEDMSKMFEDDEWERIGDMFS